MGSCGLTNLATCLPEKFFKYISSALSAPIQPFVAMVKKLLVEPANVQTFLPLWAVIISIISLFYGIFFLIAGFNLMISGYDSAKRENANYWLRNIILMIIFVQSSFFIYDLIIELSSLLTSGMLNIIDPDFFTLKVTSIYNIGMKISLLLPYVLVLINTIVLLGLRYLFAVVGVVLFPFAIFFYFIPPLQPYGKLILNFLMVIIFLPFFDAVILFGASALLDVSVFSTYNIILTIVAFSAVNLLMIFLIIFALIKAAFSVLNSDVGRGVKKVATKFLV